MGRGPPSPMKARASHSCRRQRRREEAIEMAARRARARGSILSRGGPCSCGRRSGLYLAFLPFATITTEARLAISAASLRASSRLAKVTSLASNPFASGNLDARVRDVQPLRVYDQSRLRAMPILRGGPDGWWAATRIGLARSSARYACGPGSRVRSCCFFYPHGHRSCSLRKSSSVRSNAQLPARRTQCLGSSVVCCSCTVSSGTTQP